MAQGKKMVSDQEIIEYIREEDAPFISADELGTAFDHTRQWGHQRLQALQAEGSVEKKKAGPRSVIWYLPETTTNPV